MDTKEDIDNDSPDQDNLNHEIEVEEAEVEEEEEVEEVLPEINPNNIVITGNQIRESIEEYLTDN